MHWLLGPHDMLLFILIHKYIIVTLVCVRRYTVYTYNTQFRLFSLIITAPGVVPNVRVTCGPVDLMNQCTVTWDVSSVVFVDDVLFFACMGVHNWIFSFLAA